MKFHMPTKTSGKWPDFCLGQKEIKKVEHQKKEGIKDFSDLFLEMKSRFPNIEDKKLKSYAIRLCAEGVLDLRRAKE